MDHEFDRAMLSCLSWSLYQPASTARRTIDTSDDPNPFKRLTYVPLSADDRGRTVLTGEITALLGGEYEVAVSIGARGQPTSLGGVLDAIDAALSGRATAEMLADLRDRGGLRAMEADRKRWQQLGPNLPREPTIFEAWTATSGRSPCATTWATAPARTLRASRRTERRRRVHRADRHVSNR